MNRLIFFRLRWLWLMMLLALTGLHADAKPAKLLDLADTVAANPILTKMSAIIQASDLGTFLSSKGPFTLFAPTDSAFARLPPGTLETLLRPENKERLQHILLFHVVNGKRLGAKDLIPLKSLLSCEGNPLAIRTNKLGVQRVMNAKIIHADIKCQNGVINQVDAVLMPPESALPPIAPPAPPAPTPPPVNNTNAAPLVTPVTTSADINPPIIPLAPVSAPDSLTH